MNNLQKITLRLSEVRSRLNEISVLEGEALTEKISAESETLQTEYKELETRNRAAIIAEQDETEIVKTEDAEIRELKQLTEKSNIGDIFSAAVEHRNTAGETAELQQHYGINANQIPIEMLRIDRGVEERAAATVPAKIGDASQAQVVTPVFASVDGAFLSIERPTPPEWSRCTPIAWFIAGTRLRQIAPGPDVARCRWLRIQQKQPGY